MATTRFWNNIHQSNNSKHNMSEHFDIYSLSQQILMEWQNDWKRAEVSPIFKTGDEHMVNYYRPVLVLPIISKIIEKHVFNSFYEYLSENHLITSSQSGFRPKHSCETALNCLIGRWLKKSDQGKLTGVLFIDLSKAFDTVNHNVLIHKLKSFSICENTVSKK